MIVPEDDLIAFRKYVMERSRCPHELPDAKDRALMACIGMPIEIQKWLLSLGAAEPLFESIAATIRSTELAAYERAARTIEARAVRFDDHDHHDWVIEDLASVIRALAEEPAKTNDALHDKGGE